MNRAVGGLIQPVVEKDYALPVDAAFIAVAPDGGRLYVTGYELRDESLVNPSVFVYVLDVERGDILGRSLLWDGACDQRFNFVRSAALIGPGGNLLVHSPLSIYLVDAVTGAVQAVELASPGEQRVSAVTASPDGSTIYACVESSDWISSRDRAPVVKMIDAAQGCVVGSFDAVPHLNQMTMSPDGRALYMTHGSGRDESRTTAMSLVTGEEIGAVSSDFSYQVVSSPDGTALYVSSVSRVDGELRPQVQVLDAATMSLSAVVDLPFGAAACWQFPHLQTMSPDGRRLFFAMTDVFNGCDSVKTTVVVDTGLCQVTEVYPGHSRFVFSPEGSTRYTWEGRTISATVADPTSSGPSARQAYAVSPMPLA